MLISSALSMLTPLFLKDVMDTVENSAIVSDHRAIAEAIARRDEDAAKQLMGVHLSRYQVDKTHLLEHYPAEYFKQSSK